MKVTMVCVGEISFLQQFPSTKAHPFTCTLLIVINSYCVARPLQYFVDHY